MPNNTPATPNCSLTSPVKSKQYPWAVFTTTEDYRIYLDYFKNTLRSSPFDSSSIKEIEDLTNDFWDQKKSITYDIKEVEILLKNLRESLAVFKNSNKAIEAYIEIKITKLMILIENDLIKKKNTLITEKEKNELALSIRNRLFPERAKKPSTYYALKKTASIKNVEAYCFLGKTKLRDLSSVIDMALDDPIGSFFAKHGFKFDIREILSDEDFSLKIYTMVNTELLNNYNLFPTMESVEEYTKRNQKLTNKAIINISNKINATHTVNDILTDTTPVIKDKKEQDKSPSYNKFEEHCLKLMDMMEDIINDDYAPEFETPAFKVLLEVLHDMNSELYNYWSDAWEGFDHGETK